MDGWGISGAGRREQGDVSTGMLGRVNQCAQVLSVPPWAGRHEQGLGFRGAGRDEKFLKL